MTPRGKRWSTAFLYVAGATAAGWAVFDLFAATGLKAYAGSLFFAAAGIRPLGLLAWYGAPATAPEWFTGKRPEDEDAGPSRSGKPRSPTQRA